MGFLLGELAQFFSARKEIANKMIVPKMPSAIGILTLGDTISIVVEHRVKLPRWQRRMLGNQQICSSKSYTQA
jgi:hypothetical protein